MSSALSVKLDGCLLSRSDIWSSCWCVLSRVSGLREGDGDTAVAAEWNRWWMTCQNEPCRLHRRLYWQPQLLHLPFSISKANRGSCRPQMGHVNIAPVIAHLSTSHLKEQVSAAALLNETCCNGQTYKGKQWNEVATQGGVSNSRFVVSCRCAIGKDLAEYKPCWCGQNISVLWSDHPI